MLNTVALLSPGVAFTWLVSMMTYLQWRVGRLILVFVCLTVVLRIYVHTGVTSNLVWWLALLLLLYVLWSLRPMLASVAGGRILWGRNLPIIKGYGRWINQIGR